MTEIERHDPGSIEDWQSSYTSLVASQASLLEHLPEMPLAVGQIITVSWQRAALASLRGDEVLPELCDCVRLGAAGAAATLLAAQWDNGWVRVRLAGRDLTFAATGANSLASSASWLTGFSLALIVRDSASLRVLAEEETIQASERSSTQGDAFWSPLQRALVALWKDSKTDWRAFAAEAEKLLLPDSISIAPADYVQWLIHPLLQVGEALVANDQSQWNRVMEDALTAHRSYYGRSETRYDNYGFLAFHLLGLAALAQDRGIKTEVVSDYLPASLVRGECVSQQQLEPEMIVAQARSLAEAYLYMELRGCSPKPADHELVEMNEYLVSIYTSPATPDHPQCRFAFALPDKEPSAPFEIGGNEPSALIDAGEFLWLADEAAKQVPANSQGLSATAQRQRTANLQHALAYLGEVIKFIPPAADQVAEEAFWSKLGHDLRDQAPGRFQKARLEATQQAWQQLLHKESTDVQHSPNEAEDRLRALAGLEVIKAQVRPLLATLPAMTATELVQTLQPQAADYTQVFQGIAPKWLHKRYDQLWAEGIELAVRPDQTEIEVHAAPAGMLAEENELSWYFPGGYRKIAGYLNPHRIWVAWKYLRPGESSGMAFDGLVWIDDHWAWFPKPYRLIGQWLNEAESKE